MKDGGRGAKKRFVATGLNMLDVIEIEGKRLPAERGGIPMYGYCGMRPWTDSIEFMARVGRDFYHIFDPWFSDNAIDPRALRFVSDSTPYCVMLYDAEMNGIPGGYFFTKNWSDSDLWRPQPEDLEDMVGSETEGFYICGAPRPAAIWDELLKKRDQYGFKIMWEPNGSHTSEKDREPTHELCSELDMASFNVPEGMRIFGADSEEGLLKILKRLGPELVLLRCGARGLYAISEGESWFIPSAPVPEGCSVADTTGCGNTSTSGACVAWCRGNDPVMTGIMANISSNYNLRQKGPYPVFNDELMAEAESTARKLYAEGKYKRVF